MRVVWNGSFFQTMGDDMHFRTIILGQQIALLLALVQRNLRMWMGTKVQPDPQLEAPTDVRGQIFELALNMVLTVVAPNVKIRVTTRVDPGDVDANSDSDSDNGSDDGDGQNGGQEAADRGNSPSPAQEHQEPSSPSYSPVSPTYGPTSPRYSPTPNSDQLVGEPIRFGDWKNWELVDLAGPPGWYEAPRADKRPASPQLDPLRIKKPCGRGQRLLQLVNAAEPLGRGRPRPRPRSPTIS